MSKALVPSLKKTANHLGIPVDDEKLEKAELVDRIVRRLETLLKDLCGICNQYFSNSLHEQPLFTCLICEQGCHEPCYREIGDNYKELPENMKTSFRFICTNCQSDFTKNASTSTLATKSPTKSNNLDNEAELVGTPASHEIIITGEGAPPPLTPDDHKSEENNQSAQTCPAYKWGRCPEYGTCKFRHPPRCWNWLEKGSCSYNKKCKYHHPPLCYQSLWHGSCYDQQCKFFHLSRTSRYRDDEQLKNALQPAAYQAQSPPPQNYQTETMYQPTNHQPVQTMPHCQSGHIAQHGNQPSQVTMSQPATRQPVNGNPQPYRQNPVNQQYQQQVTHSENRFSTSEISFLVKTIKDAIKDDFGKEIADIVQQNLPQNTHSRLERTCCHPFK